MAKTGNKLTSTMLKNLKIGKNAYGSNLRATKNKSGITFYTSFTINGIRIQEKIGTDKKFNLTEAIQQANRIRNEKEREMNFYGEQHNKTAPLLSEASNFYLNHLRIHKGKNYKKKEQHLRLHILPFLGDYKVKNLKNNIINNFRENLLTKKNLSHASVNRNLATLNHLVKFCCEEGFIETFPYKVMQYKEDYQGRDRILPEEKSKLLKMAKRNNVHPLLYLFVLLGFGTGMRHREMLTMRWERINWKTGTIYLPLAKGGRRHQPLPSCVIEELQAMRKNGNFKEGFVFAAQTKTGHINDFCKQFKKLCESAGLKKIYTPHYMRHTKVTELVEAGYADNIIKEITGHRTSVMIAHYSHLRGSLTVREALDAWNPLES